MKHTYYDPEHSVVVQMMDIGMGWLVTSVGVSNPIYKRRGFASSLMREVLTDADREEVSLFLSIDPSPGPGNLDEEGLRAWYRRLGFSRYDDSDLAMVRRPVKLENSYALRPLGRSEVTDLRLERLVFKALSRYDPFPAEWAARIVDRIPRAESVVVACDIHSHSPVGMVIVEKETQDSDLWLAVLNQAGYDTGDGIREVGALMVHKDFSGKGIARSLVKSVISSCHLRNLTTYGVTNRGPRAVSTVFEAVGGKPVARFSDEEKYQGWLLKEATGRILTPHNVV